MDATTSPIDLVQTLAEPTRLRIMNCLAAAPLFVSDLQEVLGLPQSTVSRHLQVLRRAALVRDTPVTPFVIYRLRHPEGATGRLLHALLEAVGLEEPMAGERSRAQQRSRADYFARVSQETADAPAEDDQQAPRGGSA
jgi:ArsR family transcriptional regulator